MMMGQSFVAIFLASLAGAQAFVHLPTAVFPRNLAVAPPTLAMSADGGGLTRTEAVRRAVVGSGVLAAGVVLTPQKKSSAGAEESKDGLEQFGELRGQLEKKGKDEQLKENLVLLTEATAGLKTLDFYIGEKDYLSLRTAMRRPPIVYLRSSARKVIINMDNEIEAKKAQTAYTAMITSVDELDSLANKGLKEKDGLKDNKELLELYGKCVERGSTLLAIVPAST